jgi:protein involved in polysaccharide export with SLBB domain
MVRILVAISLILTGLVFQVQETKAQIRSLQTQDLSQVRVDDLTDEQIREMIRQAESNGLSDDDLVRLAVTRGMSMAESQKLKSRISSVKAQGSTTSPTSGGVSSRTSRQPIEEQPEDELFGAIIPKRTQGTLTYQQSRIFGLDLFSNDKLTFEPSLNIPTPKNYQLGPGDELVIDIYGASQENYRLQISPEGNILIPRIGPIFVNGLAIEDASQKIIGRLAATGYSGLRPGGNTQAQVSLGNVRTIKVSLVGQVNAPGTYSISSLSTAFNALYHAGGPTVNGSLRQIQIFRESKLIADLDVYDFLLRGDAGQNVRLQDQDVIIVKPYLTRVELLGEVKRPGIFEMKEGESLEQLLNFAGGFTPDAYSYRIKATRKTERDQQVVDVSNDEFATFLPRTGDVFSIGSVLERFQNRVVLSGAVYREGDFELTQNLTLKKLIERAEGLRGDAFLSRVSLFRTKEDFTVEVLPIDLAKLMQFPDEDIVLQREDIIRIPSIYDLKEEYFVQISGEVNSPGLFPFAQKLSVEDLILQAGGLKESASSSFIEIARRSTDPAANKLAEIIKVEIDANLKMIGGSQQIILTPFDHVFVRRSPNYRVGEVIKIEGEVQYPGAYTLQKKNERISDVIERAGGFNDFSYLRGATLIRRTEYFQDTELTLAQKEELEKLALRSFSGSRAIGLSESERRYLSRLENEPERFEGSIRNEKPTIDQLKTEQIAELTKRDSLISNYSFKYQEMVGIDLEKIMKNKGSKYDLILQDGDVLHIPRELQTVRVRGELLYPNTVRFDRSNSFRSYIANAGGFGNNARPSKSYVVYANGQVDRARRFLLFTFYPTVEPGSEIIVPKKPEKQRMGAGEIVGITSGAATLTLLILNILNSIDKSSE